MEFSSLPELPNLQRLRLYSCNMSLLNSNLFQNMTNLESLEIVNDGYDCRGDVIKCNKVLKFDYECLPKLKRLIVYGNEMFEFPQTLPPELLILQFICNCDLQKINLKHSCLQVLDIYVVSKFEATCLSELPSLRHLRVIGNLKSSISLDHEIISNLESLSLRFSEFKNIDFSLLKNLKYLELKGISGSSDKYPPEIIKSQISILFSHGLELLEELLLINLGLSNSDFEDCDVFSNFKSLRVLNLSENGFELVDRKSFKSLGNLLELDISKNKLRDFKPEVFFDLFPKLRELVLKESKNILNEFQTFFNSHSLNVLVS